MHKSNFKLVIVLVFIFLAALFLIQNTQVVEINVLVWNFSMSASLIVISMLIFGIFIGWFSKSYLSYKNRKKERNTEFPE